ncbi:MAG: SDR family NAD(P)-dependent oxidoreductase [Anaerolineae bacterium]|jgi:NAD(P)-dependent dehydrogenase (short-subunit alcohol dehydrogenase family)|nr:SDR family NAD(P)-dependent oxidoreductase [Anaerolineae bacterium]
MSGRAAIVWGAGGGIGGGLVRRLAAEGWRVIAVTRRPDDVDGAIASFDANVADPFSVQRAVMAAGQEAGEVDLFVYSAGDIVSQPVADMTPDGWRRVLDANLNGAFYATRYCLPLLSPAAPLIFVGAVSERMRLPGLSAYAAAKAGLEAFADALRKEERKRKVIVLRPGAVNTGFWAKVPFKMPAAALTVEQVAEKALEAIGNGSQGNIDL